MITSNTFWQRPGWVFCLLLPLFHYASVQLTFFCAVTPEHEVIVWLPNAVLLAALLRFRGQRAPLMAALVYVSDVLANQPPFPLPEALLLGLVNLFEVTLGYQLMRRAGTAFRLQRLGDMGRFVLAGPLLASLLASMLAAVVLRHFGAATAWFTLARLWWYGDALGLLIYTPLLLAFTQRQGQAVRLTRLDDAALVLTLMLAGAVLSARGGEIGGVTVTPSLLLPAMAVIAFRFGTRLTALAVALISVATALMMTTGLKPFGDVPVHLEALRAQEFILTLCIIGIGFAALVGELQARDRKLATTLRQRDRERERGLMPAKAPA